MTDLDWLTLCMMQEAAGEIADGRAAIVRVVLNRTRARYASAGTIQSTITWPTQFSWVEFAMVGGHYQRVCSGPAQVATRVAQLLAQSRYQAAVWGACQLIAEHVQTGIYRGELYDQLTDDTLLYDNLALARPAWAVDSAFVCKIGRHSFFRDPHHGASPRQSLIQPPSLTLSSSKGEAPPPVQVDL